MIQRLRSDCIATLPLFFIALAISYLSFTLSRDPLVHITTIAIACLLIAPMPLALEYENKTLGFLLAQPLTRNTLWNQKLYSSFMLSGTLLLITIPPLFFLQNAQLFLFPAILLASCLTCQALTYVFKNYFITVITLLCVYLGIGIIAAFKIRADDWYVNLESVFEIITLSTLLFSLPLHYWARKKFQHAEWNPHFAPTPVPAPTKLINTIKNIPVEKLGFSAAHATLIRKELMLVKEIIALAVINYVLMGLGYSALVFFPSTPEWFSIIVAIPTLLCVIGVPLIIGTYCIGFEKQNQITYWHMSLPLSLRAQWHIKVATLLILNAVVSLGIPFGITAFFGILSPEIDFDFIQAQFPLIASINLIILTLALFSASAFSSTTKALSHGLVSAFLMTISGPLIAASWYILSEETLNHCTQFLHDSWPGFIISATLITFLYLFSYFNYLNPVINISRIVKQSATTILLGGIWVLIAIAR